jgi:puromycin-sensitive aminopeptidase
MTAVERFNLLNDTWAATLAGMLPVTDFLNLTAHFKGETDRHAWVPLLASFGFLARVVPPDLRPHLERLVRNRLGDVAARLGWSSGEAEDDLVRELRGEILRTMGTLGNDPDVQREARRRHAAERGMGALDPNVITAVISIVAHAGGQTEYDEFLSRLKAADTPQTEQRYLRALAGFRPPDLIRRTLDLSINGQVRTQDAPFLVRDLLMGVHSRELAWAFVKDHWEEMERLYPSQTGLRRLCDGLTGLATPALETDVLEFFASRRVSLGGKALEQSLEQLRIAVAFGAREADGLAASLAQF